MKKKIIIAIISFVLLILISVTIYIFITLNKDLSCTKSYTYENIEIVETINAKFENTQIKEVIGKFEMTFKNQKEASEYYSNYKNKQNLLILGNKITYSTDETNTFKKIDRNRYTLKKNLESTKPNYICN